MNNAMQTGYVFKLAGCVYGILTYQPHTQLLCRVTESDSVRGACHELARGFAGEFSAADADQAAWGRAVFHSHGTALVLTQLQGGE